MQRRKLCAIFLDKIQGRTVEKKFRDFHGFGGFSTFYANARDRSTCQGAYFWLAAQKQNKRRMFHGGACTERFSFARECLYVSVKSFSFNFSGLLYS